MHLVGKSSHRTPQHLYEPMFPGSPASWKPPPHQHHHRSSNIFFITVTRGSGALDERRFLLSGAFSSQWENASRLIPLE